MAKFIKDLVDKIALQATMQGGYVPKQEIVKMLATASIDLFNTFYGKAKGLHNGKGTPAIAYQVSTLVTDALHPFLREQLYGTGAGTMPIAPDGSIDAPAGMIHPTAFETGNGAYPVEVLDDGQKIFGLKDPAFGPTADFPKATVRPGTGYRIYPVPAAVTITYLTLPPTPVYVETYGGNGVAAYDDVNSVDVGWGRQHESTLIDMTLIRLAQSIKDGQLMQTSTALAQESL